MVTGKAWQLWLWLWFRASLRAGVWTNLTLALASSVTLAADAAPGITATANWLWHLAVS